MPEPWQTILTLAAGVATGVLSGMFGVGGAVVSTPAIRVRGGMPPEAVGSTLPSTVPSAVSGSIRYRREGLIIGRVACWTLAAGLAATVGGALLAGTVPGDGHLLMILTAGLLAFAAPPGVRRGAGPGAPAATRSGGSRSSESGPGQSAGCSASAAVSLWCRRSR